MAKRPKDQNQKAVALVSKVTKTPMPKGEDLLGSEELKRSLRQAKASARINK